MHILYALCDQRIQRPWSQLVFVGVSRITDNPDPFKGQVPNINFRRDVPPGPPAVGYPPALVWHEIRQRERLQMLSNNARNNIGNNNGPLGKANCILQRSERIAQMNQDRDERDNIESTDLVGHLVSSPMN